MRTQRRGRRFVTTAFVVCGGLLCLGRTSIAAKTSGNYSGWRGGIGIASSMSSQDIPDITELGYEIVWGSEDPRVIRALDLSVFRYWNSVVETSLKGPSYDFTGLADKDEAARRAFDALMASEYGIKGLSKYAQVRYNPKGDYGDVYGSMDLSSKNELVQAVIASQLHWFEKNGVTHGGIGLDNAGKVPRAFLKVLTSRFNARGLGIAANGCPDEYLPFIDFFGNEGFPFSIDIGRRARSKGLRGILGEFTMQHLSGGELEAYLESKLFNGIVFFGYTNGGTAAGAKYSGYTARPDVYNHQRWVFRRLVPLSRALHKAGRQKEPLSQVVAGAQPSGAASDGPTGAETNAEGKVQEEKGADADLQRITGRSPATPGVVARYGQNIAGGIYLYVDSGKPEEVSCNARKLGITPDTIVFDELAEKRLNSRLGGGTLRFRTSNGLSIVQLGSRGTVARNLLARVEENLKQQLTQRKMDRELGFDLLHKAWPSFCQGWKMDKGAAFSGQRSLYVEGGIYTGVMPQWEYFKRQGAAQLVRLNQMVPQPILLTIHSKAENVLQSDELDLNILTSRRNHFNVREAHTYCAHLYLDFQDGRWPEVYTVTFSSGTHDWEVKTIRVTPTRPVKTAMVMIEFHQPQGKAWFDDLVLAQADQPGRNLLAYPGFEENDPVAGRALAAGDEYEYRAGSLLRAVGTARRDPLKQLTALKEQVNALADWIESHGIAPHYSRELRDLDDARHKLNFMDALSGP